MMILRLNLRSVPEPLVREIDENLKVLNERGTVKITRSQYVVTLLSRALLNEKSDEANNISDQLADLLLLVNEHLTAEKLLVGALTNNATNGNGVQDHAK